MIILITGASHTGKTLLAQKMLEKYNYPYLSIDHLKMGLIRSGNTLEDGQEFETTAIQNKLVHATLEELNGKYYDIMYNKKQIESEDA